MKKEFLKLAIELSKKAPNEVPVAAVIVKNGEIIASAVNERETTNDITSHAEIVAIKKAAQCLNNWRLEDCELYVTLEPCPMCAWAILQSRISKVYFGSYDLKYGAFGSATDLSKISDSTIQIYGGILEEECDKILKEFWDKKRAKR